MFCTFTVLYVNTIDVDANERKPQALAVDLSDVLLISHYEEFFKRVENGVQHTYEKLLSNVHNSNNFEKFVGEKLFSLFVHRLLDTQR